MKRPPYVFSDRPGGGVLFVHKRDCSRLTGPGEYRECPEEVVALVRASEPTTGFARPAHVVRTSTDTRSLGLCPTCLASMIGDQR
jgi:hypothetical protein